MNISNEWNSFELKRCEKPIQCGIPNERVNWNSVWRKKGALNVDEACDYILNSMNTFLRLSTIDSGMD